MRIRRLLGLALATAALAGASALGAASAQAAAPTITSTECTDQGGTVRFIPYGGGEVCKLPDGSQMRIG
ncbi:hypothetical protein ACFQ7O_33920 [Streptomyces sp. NPDC056485]|uniref:hypothetical protein n=1 Tax=Streptomyces sp. NPDC056485 TaxID=3345834 RepID=UPI0036A94754